MKSNENNNSLGKTDFMEARAKDAAYNSVENTIQLLSGDFPLRTVKEELEREIGLRAKKSGLTRDEIIKELRRTCGDVNVSNWLNGKAKALTKESALKIAFALKMSAKEASWFFMQSCWLDGFYARDYKDLIYCYCLDAKLDYGQAKESIARYSYLDDFPNPDPGRDTLSGQRLTDFLRESSKHIASIDELHDFISKNQKDFGSFRRPAYEIFMELYNEIRTKEKENTSVKAEPGSSYISDEIPTDEEIFEEIAMNIPSLKGQKAIIGDVLKKIAEDSLSRTTAAEIAGKNELRKTRKITEVKRKHLLLMWLYVNAGVPDYSGAATEEEKNEIAEAEFENCIHIINDDLLEPCGMPLLDPRNPLDWIIMNALHYTCFAGKDDDESDDTVERMNKVMERLFQIGDKE